MNGGCVCDQATKCSTCGEDGVCRVPVALSAVNEVVTDFAVGANVVFAAVAFGLDRRVMTFPLEGGASTIIASGTASKSSLVAGDGAVDFAFAADATPVSFAHLEGCPGGVCAPLLTMPVPLLLEVHGGYVYWVTLGRSLERCALTGCGGTPESIATLPSTPGTILMKVDASGVYVVDAKSLMRIVPGSPLETLAPVAWPNSVALDGDRIYVMERDGTIVVSKTGAFPPTTYYSVLEGLFTAHQVSTDGTWVYFLARVFPMGTTDTIWRCAAGLVCTDPQVVVRNVGGLNTTLLANDATHLYAAGSKLNRYPK